MSLSRPRVGAGEVDVLPTIEARDVAEAGVGSVSVLERELKWPYAALASVVLTL